MAESSVFDSTGENDKFGSSESFKESKRRLNLDRADRIAAWMVLNQVVPFPDLMREEIIVVFWVNHWSSLKLALYFRLCPLLVVENYHTYLPIYLSKPLDRLQTPKNLKFTVGMNRPCIFWWDYSPRAVAIEVIWRLKVKAIVSASTVSNQVSFF